MMKPVNILMTVLIIACLGFAARMWFEPKDEAPLEVAAEEIVPPQQRDIKAEATAGGAQAQFDYALSLLSQGTGDKAITDEAVSWLMKAADQNHAPSQAMLGGIYLKGTMVETDVKKAEVFLQKAADQNDSSASDMLALLYLSDEKNYPQLNA